METPGVGEGCAVGTPLETFLSGMETLPSRPAPLGSDVLETFLSGMETVLPLLPRFSESPLKPSLVEWKQGPWGMSGWRPRSLETFLSGMETCPP